jgi:hypothetical protein
VRAWPADSSRMFIETTQNRVKDWGEGPMRNAGIAS